MTATILKGIINDVNKYILKKCMKKVVIILGLFIFHITCFSQESGILKDTLHRKTSIFLSKVKIVSNKDYPVFMKDKIIEFKNNLDKNEAEKILLASLVLKNDDNDISYLLGLDDILYINNGLGINLIFTTPAETETKRTETFTNYTSTTTTPGHGRITGKHPIFVPFSEFRHIRIQKIKDNYTVQFMTKLFMGKGPYLGVNKFVFKIKPEADEVALIASLLYLCNNIKDSNFIDF